MGFFLLLAFSILFTAVAPSKETPHSSCSSKFKALLPHLKTSQGSFHLPLHHPRSPCSPAPLPPTPFSTILLHDDSRVISLCSRFHKKHHRRSSNISPSSTSHVPLSPGTSFGVGNYVTNIRLGTPSSSYVMVVDTGSSLTWLQCSPCNVSCHDQVGSIFDPSASTSYSSIPCSASECSSLPSATLNPAACSTSNVCIYQASYGDSSFSVGFLGKDTLKLGSLAIPKFIYGCGQDNEGLFGKSAGLMGLARNDLSLLTQVSKKTGTDAFSYCLPTIQSTGLLSFGPYDASKFSFTPMVKNSLDDSLYFVKLESIKLDNKSIPVSSSSYDTPTIIDSGTVITRLPSDVYSALKDTLTTVLTKKKYASAGSYSILDTCFAGSASKMSLPEVSMVFEGGAAIKLSTRNVMIDIDDTMTCLAFAAATKNIAIIGNRQQQTSSVVYDVAKEKIGFASGGCG